jgi:hypothetical protein
LAAERAAGFGETVFAALVALADGFLAGISYSGLSLKDAGLYRPKRTGPPVPDARWPGAP